MNIKFKDGWIAKDKNGSIYYYLTKPYINYFEWDADESISISKYFDIDIDFWDFNWKDSLYQVKDGNLIKYTEKLNLKVDDLVMVSADETSWYYNYFASWPEDGLGICVWADGASSITSRNKYTIYWPYYKKYEK